MISETLNTLLDSMPKACDEEWMLRIVEIRQFGHPNVEQIAKWFVLQLIFYCSYFPVSPFSVFLSIISLLLSKTSSRQLSSDIRLFTSFLRVGRLLKKGEVRIHESQSTFAHPLIQSLLSASSVQIRKPNTWGPPLFGTIITLFTFSLYPLFDSEQDCLNNLSLTFIFISYLPSPFWTSLSYQCSLLAIPWAHNLLSAPKFRSFSYLCQISLFFWSLLWKALSSHFKRDWIRLSMISNWSKAGSEVGGCGRLSVDGHGSVSSSACSSVLSETLPPLLQELECNFPPLESVWACDCFDQ